MSFVRDAWSLESWLASFNCTRLVAKALLMQVRSNPELAADPRAQYAFAKSLGGMDKKFIASFLDEAHLLDTIATELAKASGALRATDRHRKEELQAKAEEEAAAKAEAERRKVEAEEEERLGIQSPRHQKKRKGTWRAAATTAATESFSGVVDQFVAKGAHELYFGKMSDFYKGLDGLLGDQAFGWQHDPRGAMEREHCNSVDSDNFFTTSNYGITTTAKAEWYYVVSPEKAEEDLDLDEWPGSESERD